MTSLYLLRDSLGFQLPRFHFFQIALDRQNLGQSLHSSTDVIRGCAQIKPLIKSPKYLNLPNPIRFLIFFSTFILFLIGENKLSLEALLLLLLS